MCVCVTSWEEEEEKEEEGGRRWEDEKRRKKTFFVVNRWSGVLGEVKVSALGCVCVCVWRV